MSDLEFSDAKGATLTKKPGSINGEGFVLKNLTECSVYLLDYTSEVEVTNCENCQIFIGPVDGPAIFDGCKNCQVAVACQQFQAKNCDNIEFGLYCATQPSINASTEIRFGCWMGAYPKLTSHFAAANLDPHANSWDKVYDGSASEDGKPNFELIDIVHYWEVPIEGEGPPENPVPAADGAAYTPSPDANGTFAEPVENGHAAPAPPPPAREQPQVTAMLARMKDRLAKQEQEEAAGKTALAKKASSHLDAFYAARNKQKEQRCKDNRAAEKTMAVKGPEGDTPWEKAINMINFSFGRPNGSDLSRYKGLLFTAKSKNVPIATRS